MSQRELAELRSLFGRSTVDEALAHWDEVKRWVWEHPTEVVTASSELQKKLHNPPAAVAYAASLNEQLKVALIVAILEA